MRTIILLLFVVTLVGCLSQKRAYDSLKSSDYPTEELLTLIKCDECEVKLSETPFKGETPKSLSLIGGKFSNDGKTFSINGNDMLFVASAIVEHPERGTQIFFAYGKYGEKFIILRSDQEGEIPLIGNYR